MNQISEKEFINLYLGYLNYLEEKMKKGRVIFKLINYNNPGKSSPGQRNDRELIQILDNKIYLQEINSISGRKSISFTGLKELYAFYKYFNGDLQSIKKANHKNVPTLSNISPGWIECKKPLLINMLEEFLAEIKT